MAAPTFLVHTAKDSVGIVVVEGIESGQDLNGWILETDKSMSVHTLNDIPMGHKVALINIANGDTIIKYGHDVGRATVYIAKGQHVHVHNVKTNRW